jgi:hypothetical protein
LMETNLLVSFCLFQVPYNTLELYIYPHNTSHALYKI